MTGILEGSGLSLALCFAGAFLLIAVLRSTSKVIYWLPLSRRGLSRAQKWLPVIATTLAVLYAVVATQWLLGGIGRQGLVAGGVLAMLAAASWRAICDATDGLFLRATGACRVGDYVQLDGADGRIRELGWRFMTLETSEGHVATVPYGRAARSSLRRLPEVKHGLRHAFRLEPPGNLALPVVKRSILRAALLCPWCVPKRNARIRTLEQGKALEVTLSLIDADHATEAEEVIRETVRNLLAKPPEGRPRASDGSLPAHARARRDSSQPPTTRTRPSVPSPSNAPPPMGRVGSRGS